MKTIRVLQVGLTSNIGGTETFVMNLYRHIDRKKIQFDFLVDHDKRLPFEEEIVKMGGRVFYEYYYVREKNKSDYSSPEEFFKKHTDIDAVHLNVQELNTLVRVLQAAKKAGIKTRILHSHNAGYMYKRNIKQKLYEAYARMQIDGLVTQRLACSDAAAEFLFRGKGEYTVVPNAIDVKKFAFCSRTRQMLRSALGVREDEVLLGFVGSFNFQKNIGFILDIMRNIVQQNDKYKLLMLGQGELFETAQNTIKENKLEEHVICPGNKPNVNEYMSAMDLFLLPSRFEGFGIVLLEAQANGLKCFTSDGAVPVAANVTGNVTYLPLEDGAECWAKKICVTEKSRYDGQSVLSNSKYDIDKMIVMIENIYTKE